MIKTGVLVIGMIHTNCYVIYDTDTKEAILVDPGDEAERILSYLSEHDYVLKAIILTHGHFDHMMGVRGIKEKLLVPVYALETEKELLENPEWNCSVTCRRSTSLTADHWLKDREMLTLGAFDFQVIATPGHTQGSACYYFAKENMLFSGDTLFCESIGRTDLPTGNARQMTESLHKLLALPEQTVVYPGHGADTTIGHEQYNNPYAGGWE